MKIFTIFFVLVLLFTIHDSNADVSATSLTFKWTAPSDDGPSGNADAYSIRYSADSTVLSSNWTTATPVGGEPVPQAAGQSESFNSIINLQVGATYYFAIKSSDVAGNVSGLSTIASFTVPDVTGPSAVIDFTVQ